MYKLLLYTGAILLSIVLTGLVIYDIATVSKFDIGFDGKIHQAQGVHFSRMFYGIVFFGGAFLSAFFLTLAWVADTADDSEQNERLEAWKRKGRGEK